MESRRGTIPERLSRPRALPQMGIDRVMAKCEVGDGLHLAYRELVGAEAKLGEALAPRGLRVGVPLVDQWSTLQEYLDLYGRGHSPAGVLVLAGGPDEGSRRTGIPFTGAPEARDVLGLQAGEGPRSPSGAAFWAAVEKARAHVQDAPLESFFGTFHLAHARPFDFPAAPQVRDASARHVARLLTETRPQMVLAVGAEALATFAQAVGSSDLRTLAAAPERAWGARWPVESRPLAYPYVDVPARRPFRTRIVPVPALDGPLAPVAAERLASLFAHAWG